MMSDALLTDAPQAAAARDAAIRAAARGLTAQALVAPILKELRANARAWGPFAAGDAERSFGPMLDLAIADRIAASPRLAVAERIEARLRARERAEPGTATDASKAAEAARASRLDGMTPKVGGMPIRTGARVDGGWTA